MPKRTRDYRESLLEDLQNQNEAAAYLTAALQDSQGMFLVALRDIAAATQMAKVAEEAGVTREGVYRMLSKSGNPRLSSLCGILRALGLVMFFRPSESHNPTNPITSGTTFNEVSGAIAGNQTSAKRKGPATELASIGSSFNPGNLSAMQPLRLGW
jgi:probable addiction module antidote protein